MIKIKKSSIWLENFGRCIQFSKSLPHKVFIKDRNYSWVFVNENFARDLKIKPEEVAGKTDFDFFPKELAEKYRADDKRIMESGKIEDLEERYIQDGQEVIVNTIKVPIKDKKGNITGILGMFWVITRYRVSEEQALGRNKVLNAINNVFKEALPCETEEDLAQTYLAVGKKLTESQFGFLGVYLNFP